MQTATDALNNRTREPQVTSLMELVRHLFGLHEPARGDQWIKDCQFVCAGSKKTEEKQLVADGTERVTSHYRLDALQNDRKFEC
jgi:hypothetical protein